MVGSLIEISFWNTPAYYGSMIETPIMLENNARLNLLFRTLFLTACYSALNVEVEHKVVAPNYRSDSNQYLKEAWDFRRRPNATEFDKSWNRSHNHYNKMVNAFENIVENLLLPSQFTFVENYPSGLLLKRITKCQRISGGANNYIINTIGEKNELYNSQLLDQFKIIAYIDRPLKNYGQKQSWEFQFFNSETAVNEYHAEVNILDGYVQHKA